MPVTLSVIIPVYNNQKSLLLLFAALHEALEGKIDHEIVFINDGSIDDSWKEINKIITSYSGKNVVKGLDLKKNTGQENAKLAGLRHSNGDYVVFMDADFQHKPEHIFLLLEKCKQGADVCYANFNNSPLKIGKRFGSWVYNYLARKLLLKPKNIYLSSYNMITKKMAEEVNSYSSPLVNIDAIVLKHASKVDQIFVEQNESMNTQVNYTTTKLIALFFQLLPGFSTLPLRIILFAGGITSCLGILLLVTKTVVHFLSPAFHFLLSMNALISFTFGGIILFAIGIVGEYIGKIYTIAHSSQQYAIETSISSELNHKKL